MSRYNKGNDIKYVGCNLISTALRTNRMSVKSIQINDLNQWKSYEPGKCDADFT